MEYFVHLAILISIFSILAMSLNLIVGYTGLLSVAHAAFFGMGAYSTAIVLTTTDLGFFSSILIGILGSMIVSFLIGLVLSKFNDDYYALASLGFTVIMYSIFLNWQSLTRGPLGIPGIDRPEVFGISFSSNISFLILAAIAAVIVYVLSEKIIQSSFGRVLKGIRENEKVLQVFGYRTVYFKLTIFVIGAAMASVAGSFFASYITFIDPSSFALIESIFMLAIIILGGLANNKGAVLGAFILILLPEILRFVGLPSEIAGQMRQLIYGVLLVVLMLYRPQGMIGEYKL